MVYSSLSVPITFMLWNGNVLQSLFAFSQDKHIPPLGRYFVIVFPLLKCVRKMHGAG